jgi:Tol biopolymer transport system component
MKRSNKTKTTTFVLAILLSTLLAACSTVETVNVQKDEPQIRDRLLYLSNRDGWADLYTVDVTGKITARLTETAEAEYGAVWSPDGKKLAFTALNGDQANGDYHRKNQVIVTDAANKNRTLVAGNGFNPVWSPDGSRVLFLRFANEFDLPDTEATPVPAFGRGSVAVDAANRPVKTSLYLATADGSANGEQGSGNPTLLAENVVYARWSPDGKRIVFIAGDNDQTKPRTLQMMDANGANKINLSQNAKIENLDVIYVSWSPDGTNLAFTTINTEDDKMSLYRMSPNAPTPKRLTDYYGSAREISGVIWAYSNYFNPAPRVNFAPIWSPSSRQIAFADGSGRVSVVTAENAKVSYFAVGNAKSNPDKEAILSLSWLPDSRQIALDRVSTSRLSLLSKAETYIYDWFESNFEIVNTTSGGVLSLGSPAPGYLSPNCCGLDLLKAGTPDKAVSPAPVQRPKIPDVAGVSPSGKLIYTSGFNQRSLIVNDLKSGEQTVLTTGVFKTLDFTVSPKRDRIAYMEVGDQYNATLYVNSLDGKQRRKLSEGSGEPEDLSRVVRWSPDSKWLAFQVFKGDPVLKPGLYVAGVEEADGQSNPRLISTDDISAFDWSPDSQMLAFRVDTSQFSIHTTKIDGSSKPQLIATVGLVNRNYSALGRGLLWSPNGKHIAVTGPGGFSRFATWLVSPSGNVTEVSSSILGRLVSWSSDGNLLLASTATFNQNSDLQILDASAPNPGWRAYGPGFGPVLSPDGKNVIMFSRYNYGSYYGSGRTQATAGALNRVTLVNLNNRFQEDIQLDFPGYFTYRYRFFDWAEDSKLAAFYQNNTIFAVGTDGKNPQPIARAFAVEKLVWI